MTDRYLFRGKRTDNGEWVQGHLIQYAHEGRPFAQICNNYYDFSDKETAYTMTRVDPATVGQCAGLKDKNGTLIFEGDIFYRAGQYNGLVEWEEDIASFGWFNGDGTGVTYYEIEIIGNKHDNPELLKRKRKSRR